MWPVECYLTRRLWQCGRFIGLFDPHAAVVHLLPEWQYSSTWTHSHSISQAGTTAPILQGNCCVMPTLISLALCFSLSRDADDSMQSQWVASKPPPIPPALLTGGGVGGSTWTQQDSTAGLIYPGAYASRCLSTADPLPVATARGRPRHIPTSALKLLFPADVCDYSSIGRAH